MRASMAFAAQQCPLEDRMWTALRGRRSSSPGGAAKAQSRASLKFLVPSSTLFGAVLMRRARERCGMRCVGDLTRWRRLVITAAIGLGAALVTQIGPSPAGASTLPTGFRDSAALSRLT